MGYPGPAISRIDAGADHEAIGQTGGMSCEVNDLHRRCTGVVRKRGGALASSDGMPLA